MSEVIVRTHTGIGSKRNKEKTIEDEKKELMDKISQISKELSCANNNFDYITDSELIDGCIFEINSLNKKYSFYLRLCKEKGFMGEKI